MTVLASASELLQLVWVAPLAVVVVAASFSFLLLGATRSADHRRSGATGVSMAYLGLAVLAGVVFTATVAAGLIVITAG